MSRMRREEEEEEEEEEGEEEEEEEELESACTAKARLGRPTTHVLWDNEGAAHGLEATSGVYQG